MKRDLQTIVNLTDGEAAIKRATEATERIMKALPVRYESNDELARATEVVRDGVMWALGWDLDDTASNDPPRPTNEPQWYELVNPSDPIEFEAPDLATATIVCVVLGEGMYAATPTKGGEAVPIMAFGIPEGWFQRCFGKTCQDFVDGQLRTEDTRARAAAAFASFRIKDGRERSSLNDIVGRAHALARKLGPEGCFRPKER